MSSAGQTLEFDIDLPMKEPSKSGGEVAWIRYLPALLRGLGAAAILFSLYSFIMRGWEGGSDLLRYLLLLGHTGALAGIGLASGHWLKEGKGARLLLSLALVAVAANFAILGGFILSAVTPLQLASYPEYFTWRASSLTSALVMTAAAQLLLLPVIRIGFMALVRPISTRMGLLFLLGNAALLIPLRAPEWIAMLVIVLAAVAIIATARMVAESSATRTREGMIALLVQFLPLVILLGRNLWLYSTETLLITVSLLVIFALLRQLALMLERGGNGRWLVELVAVPVASLAAMALFDTLRAWGVDHALALPIAILLAAALIYEVASRAAYAAENYRLLASAVLLVGFLGNMAGAAGGIPSLLSVIVGVAVILLGSMRQERSPLIVGVVLTALGLLYQAHHLIEVFALGDWAALALLGVTAILIGSLLEAQGGRLKGALLSWKARYGEWSL